jgi:CubicO group peptidase (beta-lactamase class C family)
MHRRSFMQVVGSGIALSATNTWAAEAGTDRQRKFAELVRSVREKHKLPGIAATIIRDDRVVAAAVSGVRHVDKPDLITLEDRFGIGSCTKRMTALMIARVIDRGKLSFETTIGEVLPDVKMREVYRKVTLAQLLTFKGGIQPYLAFMDPPAREVLSKLTGTPAEQRGAFVAHVLQVEPITEPGGERRYSNASYAVAAFLAAKRAGREWEALVEEHVFRPLKMTRAGFGRPSNADHPNEPWLHSNGTGGPQPAGKPAAASNAPYRPQPENHHTPLALHAAGAVHCSIGDFCKFIIYELQQTAGGNDPLLSKPTAARMRELFRRSDGATIRGGSPFLSAGYTLWPNRKTAAAAMVNAGGAAPACGAIFEAVKAEPGVGEGSERGS